MYEFFIFLAAFFGVALLIMSAQNIWWYGRLWWRMLSGRTLSFKLWHFIIPPKNVNLSDTFDPQILATFNAQVGLFLWVVVALFLSKSRPSAPLEIMFMLAGDYYMFTSMVYTLLPAWRIGGRSRLRIKVEIGVRVVLALTIAFASVYSLGAR